MIYFRPVIPILVSLILGLACGSWLPGHKVYAYFVIFVSTILILYFILQRKTTLILPVILFFAFGYLSIQPWVVPKFPSNHIVNFLDLRKWRIVGLIDENPIIYKDRLKLILQIRTLGEDKDKNFPVTGKIRVTVRGNFLSLSIGDKVSFTGKIRSIRNFNNPGGFDYKKYMAFKEIWGTSYVRGKDLIVIKRNSGRGINRIIADARSKISDLIDNSVEGDESAVLKALIIGDRNSISKNLRESFNRAGAGHILAISGLHIGIVATVAFFFFKWILSYFKYFLWNVLTIKVAAILSLFPVFIYGLLSGMSPSTQRAVIMVTVFFMTFLFEREHDPINTLAIAAMIILLVHPPSLFSISFQLSFIAVLAIIYGLSRMRIKSSRRKQGVFQLPKKVYLFLLTSLFAILGTLPLLMLYFNQVSFIGFLVNLFVVPLIGFIVVPLGLFSVLLYPVSVYGATWCINANSELLAKALDIVVWFSNLPFASIKTVTPTYFEICCYYVLGWAVLNLVGIKHENTGEKDKFLGGTHQLYNKVEMKEQSAASGRKKVLAVLIVVSIACAADTCYWFYNRFWHDDLRITVIDVGQGSSALVEMPEGFNLLIDGGGFSDNSVFDIGERVIAPLLWRKKIKTIDLLILSHPNSDHLNGLLYIAENFNVKRVWANCDTADTIGYRKFMGIIKEKAIHLPEFKEISRTHIINDAQLKLLYPAGDYIDNNKRTWSNLNNNSLVIKIKFGSKSFLFPGDIMTKAEKELVAISGDDLKSNVLIAPHHGSKTSSSEFFIDSVKPETVIFSSGLRNRYKFPHPSVLKRYKERGCRILRTDSHGAVTISTDGRSLEVLPFFP
ncbi:MAG: DNA internalization-related competence protein ComEC/Rec2 [Desulfobacteraceae bacterium]|nr:DNA internalization-related competence protein ComEC/Rec2 [Desulfobacteraceae bacterium]MBC2718496.1 DNA internalization-related competence protein ComEC/Rec2 [Desulfobacteraceae bacterium]